MVFPMQREVIHLTAFQTGRHAQKLAEGIRIYLKGSVLEKEST